MEPGVIKTAADRATTRHHKIAYIEFDEQGDFFDRRQLVDALANTPVGANRLVVFYAHGWQNNTRSGDVAQFNAFLAHLAHSLNDKSEKDGLYKPWEVYGVYLSWRGTLYDPSVIYPPQPSNQTCDVEDILKKPLNNPWNIQASVPKEFTFWSRKAAANRFAGAPLLETINLISAKVRTQPTAPGELLTSRVILIGHSFGAYVIEKTVLQAITTQEPTMEPDQTTYITPPADLVILLNSAAPAIYAKEFIEFLKWHSLGNTEKPFVVSVSSEGDWATKDVFPLGTILETAFDVGSYQGKKTYGGANQKTFFTHTPGHTPYLPSFDAYPTTDQPGGNLTSQENEWIFSRNLYPTDFSSTSLRFLAWGDPFAKTEAPAHAQIWTLKPVPPVDHKATPFNDTPYWIIRVPKAIIADHGDVWCPNSVNLLTSLVRIGGLTAKSTQLRTLKLAPLTPPKHDDLVELSPY